MRNLYYLHFRESAVPEILDALEGEGAVITPVFYASFYVETNLSFGSLKHILKSSPFLTQCNLIKVKNGSEFSVVLE